MTLSDIVKNITGLAAGDKSVTILAAGGLATVQNDINSALARAGNSLSSIISPAVFSALNDGSVKTAESDLNKATGQVVAAIPNSYKIMGILAVLVLGFLMFRKR